MALRINDRLPNNDAEFYRVLTDSIFAGLRVAMPGIIESFSAETQTVTVRPAIREQIVDPDTLQPSWVDIPVLLDVPVVLPRAGGFAITAPIKPGDECLVVFADRCIDAWYSLGDVQNQMELRKHDLSDGFAIVGVSSQPRVLSNYSPILCSSGPRTAQRLSQSSLERSILAQR
ncbi:hypothetical protein LJK88_38210 [Paenibacillus sp. P26]|nr:hypothetical protein LJK88_38210 [Paenibacillus sp. P26]